MTGMGRAMTGTVEVGLSSFSIHGLGSLTTGNLYMIETAEKEVQDTSCRGSGGVPAALKVPQDWGIRELIKAITAISD
jgi:hypothetical protein